MNRIFTPWQINSLEIKNRLVRSATWEGMADDEGQATIENALFNSAPAQGGVGLVITGFAYVHPYGRCLKRQTGIHNDAMIGPLTRVSDACHKSGGKIALQIAHAGALARKKLTGRLPKAPSSNAMGVADFEVEELTLDEIKEITESFVLAADRAKRAEFDAIEIHAAHGYLLSQFASPLYNQRKDQYGGSVENRFRLCFEVLNAVRQTVGPNFPIIYKLNSEDGVQGGQTLEEAVYAAKKLDEMGCDAIEVSGGSPAAGRRSTIRPVKTDDDEGYFLKNAQVIKQAVKCPIITVGGFRTKDKVEKALETVDACALSRPLICQPDLPNLWQQGKSLKAECVSCGRCLALGLKNHVACALKMRK